MNKYIVKNGAKLKCTLGSMESELQVPKNNGAVVKQGNEAVITNFIPEVNIQSFGICNCPLTGEAPCIPVTVMPWIQGKMDYLIGEIPALMEDSILPCLKGGIISVKKHGQ